MKASKAKAFRVATSLIAFALVFSLVAGCAGSGNRGSGGGGANNNATSTPSTGGAPGMTTPDVTAAAKTVSPSVVSVTVFQQGRGTQMAAGNGSGIVIRQDGYILTNNHVVASASGETVTLGTEKVPAKVVGTDPATDLAVLKVDKTGLDAAEIGDPKSLQVGQWVIAVGFPFGLDRTVTLGIVSGLGRTTIQPSQSDVTAYTNLIQTDASINPGNSGGALADLAGRVVGVNALIESASGQNAGIGFAIPIDFAMYIADQLIKTGSAKHAFMGIGVSTSGSNGQGQGAVVESVEKGSPAADAGLRIRDVITRIGNTDITNAEDVFAAVRARRPGQRVAVRFTRNGQTQTVTVTLTGRASKPSPPQSQDGSGSGGMPLPPGHP